jgi:DsbC/DsbD-like thiol-disulfide interchange protein
LATSWQHGHGSSTRLLVGGRPEADGTVRLIAGVEIKLADGWKTYWRQPGDAGGIPPSFDWTGSVNLANARVLFPAPHRFGDQTGQSIGYKKSVVFPIELNPADPSRPVRLKLALGYGICREICVPAEAAFEAEIVPGSVTILQPELAAALARVPRAAGGAKQPGEPSLLRASAVLDGPAPKLTFEVEVPSGTAGAELFVVTPGDLYLPMAAKVGEPAQDRALFEIDLATGVEIARLKGVTLELTMVGSGGAAETAWKVE